MNLARRRPTASMQRTAEMLAAAAGVYREHFDHGKDPITGLGGQPAAVVEFEEIMDALVVCVQKAHTELLDLSCMVNWTAVDGYTKKCLKLLDSALADPNHAYDFQLITASGYGIERRCYQLFREWKQNHPPAYFKWSTQVATGMARPDIVLTPNVGTIGAIWVDITSEGDKGHVEQKTGSKSHYCEEVIYPSVNFNLVLAGVKPNLFTSSNLQKKEAVQFVALQENAEDEKMRGEIAELYESTGYQFPDFKAKLSRVLPSAGNADARAVLMFAGFSASKQSHWVTGATPNASAIGRERWVEYQQNRPGGGKMTRSGRISKGNRFDPY